MMLNEICRHIRNFFPDLSNQKRGRFTITDGIVEPSVDLLDGQYFLVEGSVLNDGIHMKGDLLNNESFYGVVTPLKIPKDFLGLVAEIEDFEKKNAPSAFSSESFGGYSYSRATNKAGQLAGWQSAFGTRLNAWRKL